MRIALLGTGVVGQTLAPRLNELGHTVTMGTRNAAETANRTTPNRSGGSAFKEWYERNGYVELVNFEAIPEVDMYINALSGQNALSALETVGRSQLAGKTLLDLTNSLDFSNGMPPSLSICNTDSLGETIQRTFPEMNVVKSLNTMNCDIMLAPMRVPGDHNVFVSGDSGDAKQQVIALLKEAGWNEKQILDLGGIITARGTEMMLPIWLQLYQHFGNSQFNFQIVRA